MLAEVGSGDAERWARDLARPAAVLLGAWDGERCIGIATGEVAVDDADVHLVVVAPDRRREGVGRALVLALCHTLAALGAARVLLEVRGGNHAARGLYVRLGFTEIARRRSYYRDGDDALVLALDPTTLPA